MRGPRMTPYRRKRPPVVTPVTPTGKAEFGTLQTLASHGVAEKAGGLNLAMVELEWRYWQPTITNGVPDRNTGVYVSNIVADVQALLNAGMKVTLGLGLHHPPAWVSTTYGTGVLYTNQAGQTSTAAVLGGGFDNIDFTLSAQARTLAEAYIADVKAALGATLWGRLTSIRDAVNGTGEQMYPQRANSGYDWWGYSARAQSGTGLATGMTAAPNTGVPTGAQVGPWLTWYMDARSKTSLWMINYLCGTLAFPGAVDVITPGSGVRPSAWTTLLAGTTLPTGNLAGVGAVWHVLYTALNAGPWASRTWMHCSSIGDTSNRVPTQIGDDALALTSTTANSWGSARWFHFMAGKFPNLGGLSGENPGSASDYSTTLLNVVMAFVANGTRWKRIYWAHEVRLWPVGTTAAALPIQLYYNAVQTYQTAALTLPTTDIAEPGVNWDLVFFDDFNYTLAEGTITPNSQAFLTTGPGAATVGAKFSFYPDGWTTTHHGKIYPATEGEPAYVAGQVTNYPPINSRYYPSKVLSFSPTTPDGTAAGVMSIRQHSEIINGVETALGAAIKPRHPSGSYKTGPYGRYVFRMRVRSAVVDGVDYAALNNFTNPPPMNHIHVPLTIDSANWGPYGIPNGEFNHPDGNVNSRIKGTYHPASNPDESWSYTTTPPMSPYFWHVYETIWVPGRVRFMIDGVAWKDTTDRVPSLSSAVAIFQHEANWRQPAGEAITEIDWIAVFDYVPA